MRVGIVSCVFVSLALLATFASAADWTWDDITPLDAYINNWDVPLNYEELSYYNYTDSLGCDMYILNFTSQMWMTPEFSSSYVWFHYLLVAIPHGAAFSRWDVGYLDIMGGSNWNPPPGAGDESFNNTCRTAMGIGGVAARLNQIPNQPINFPADPERRNRSEDEAIAYTWRQYIDLPDNPEKILQFPMTKAASRALDVIGAFANEKVPSSNVTRFFVTGRSKRGWITWLLGVTDRRVIGMAPQVLTCLNSRLNFEHHFMSLGGWSYVVNDYYDAEIFKEMYNPNLELMFDQNDPYSYRQRMTIPKIVVAGTGDEFFLTDDTHYFFDALPEPKFVMMNQNTNHGLVQHIDRVRTNNVIFYKSILDIQPLPQVNWTKQAQNGTHGWVEMWVNRPPRDIIAWAAQTQSPTMRDFRLTTAQGSQFVPWIDRPVEFLGGDVERGYSYRVVVEKRADDYGWRGIMINANVSSSYPNEDFDVTTEVTIMDDFLPFPPCVPDECNTLPLV